VGRPDPEWGEVVTAVVVPADPEAPPSLAGLRALLRDRLPVYAIPAALLLVPKLPLLPSGKPDREALRAQAVEAPRQDPPSRRWAHESTAGTNGHAER
jgi:o-succinylbenzoate---CoA ligase